MKNKRGQFYLLAAVIIIVVILAFALSSNFLQDKNPVKLYDLGEELGIESESVLNYGTFNEDSKIENFTGLYSEYAGDDKELYFVYGNEETIKVAGFRDVIVGTVSIKLGGSGSGQEFSHSKFTTKEHQREQGTTQIRILIGEKENQKEYVIELEPGENFYFIISQELDGEQHVVTP